MRTYGHVAAIVGIFGGIVFSAPTGGLSLVGAVAIGVAWIVAWTSSRDHQKQHTGGGRRMPSNLPVVGTRYPLRSYGDDPSQFLLPSTTPFPFSSVAPVSPETVLAETNPRLTARVLERMSLDRTHESIVAPAAAEFARQGRGTRATTRRIGGFLGGDGVETTIRPL